MIIKFIRKLFFLKKIYFKQTLWQIVIFYGLLALLMSLAWTFISTDYPELAGLHYFPLIIYQYFLGRTLIRTIIVNQRLKQSKHMPLFPASKELFASTASYELDKIDQIHVIDSNDQAQLYDALFNFYRRTKHGEYLAKQVYYTIYEVKLNRQLPHIIFDSKTAKRRQFKYLYLKVQKISIQGNFDMHFDTYVPQTYHIDSLSFITPEVMEELLNAKDYDIEIIGEKLMLYAPLIDMAETGKLVEHGNKIARHINDNIDTYRDNRLKGEDRLKDVTPFARTLLKSPMKYVPALVISAIAVVGILFWAFKVPEGRKDILFNELSLLAYITLATNGWKIFDLNRKNQRATKRFRVVHPG